MLTALRAAWARADFAPLRAAVGRAGDALRPAPSGRGAGRDVWINPGSGGLFRGLVPVAPGPDAPGPDAGGHASDGPASDWIVQAFPARARVTRAVPLWYGARADLAALLSEALPRHLALTSAGVPGDAVSLVSLSLGRLDCTQDALAAGAFAPRPLRVHAWDKLIGADEVFVRPEPGREALLAVAPHLRACFGVAGARNGPVLALGRAGDPALAAAVAAGARALDPDRARLADLVRAAAEAPEVAAADGAAALCAWMLAPDIPVRVTAGGLSDPRAERLRGIVGNPSENRDASVTEIAKGPKAP